MFDAETFNVGQFRRTQATNYTVEIDYTQDKIINEADIMMDFYDPILYLTADNVIDSLNSYYMSFNVNQIPDRDQKFTIELRNKEPLSEDTQTIRTFEIPKGVGTVPFELIFNPNATYDSIVFLLRRDALDYQQYNEDGTNGRFLQVTVDRFDRILNIVDTELKVLFPKIINGLKKIGIQGPPGLLFVLNGEEMRVGRSGIYELYYDDITIKYIGFVLKKSLITQDGLDYFLMDFKYY